MYMGQAYSKKIPFIGCMSNTTASLYGHIYSKIVSQWLSQLAKMFLDVSKFYHFIHTSKNTPVTVFFENYLKLFGISMLLILSCV